MGSKVCSDQDLADVMEIITQPLLIKKNVSIILALEKFVLYWTQRKAIQISDFIIAGSLGEGLTGLFSLMQKESDLDVMINFGGIVVIERKPERNPLNCKVLQLENSDLHPGYALLRTLGNDTCTTNYYSSQEIRNLSTYLIDNADFGPLLSCMGGNQFTVKGLLHGPALTFDMSFHNVQNSPLRPIESGDCVFGVHCNEWPSVADEWIERKRSDWPSGTMIAEIVEMGCDLVPTGATGNNMEKEWRISLVRAERHLMHKLNSAQLKTFALLKIIFKNGIFGDRFHKKISSYIAKTAFFWTSEEHKGDQWEDRDCLIHFSLCLRKLCYFVTKGICPNYFIRDCNVLREKLNDLEKESFSHILGNFTTKNCFKDNILSLPIITGVRTVCAGLLPYLSYLCKSIQLMNIIERLRDRALEENLGRFILMFLPTPTQQNLKSSIGELWFLLRSFRDCPLTSDISMQNIAFQDFFIRYLTCAQLRVVNTALSRNELTVNERFDILRKLLSQANLKTETLCAAEITQIAHVFFTNALYENTLYLIIPMLEEFKKVPCTRLNSIDSFVKLTCSLFLNMNDVSFTSPRRPICDITFFNLEESILTEHLRIEIVSAELGYEIDVESGKSESLECLYHVNVHPLVYACYMKYKCCRYMERNIDSCRALRELEGQVLEITEHEYYNVNLLGCSLYESGKFEKAMKIFALSYKNVFIV